MTITEPVINDLLPVYFSGEASADTKALVDTFFASHPVFGDRARREWTASLAPSLGATIPSAPVVPTAELRSLRRTRRVLGVQRWLFAAALACTLMPASVAIRITNGRPTSAHLLAPDYPVATVALLVSAGICWSAYLWLRRGLRVG
jgi:hypothetical protein